MNRETRCKGHIAGLLFGGLVLTASLLQDAKGVGVEPWIAPLRAAQKQNPIPTDEASLAKGKALYLKECVSCHGTKGKGDGPAVKDLDTDPGDITSKATRSESDGAIFWKLTEGRKPMPSYEKTLTEEDRWHIINYIRSFAPEKPPTVDKYKILASPKGQQMLDEQKRTRMESSVQEVKSSDKYVTREEYEKVLNELAGIKAQLQGRPPTSGQTNTPPPVYPEELQAKVQNLEKKQETQQAETDQSLDALDKKLKDIRSETKSGIPGSNRMLVSGYGAGTFEATRNGYGPSQGLGDTPAPGAARPGRSAFTANFSPIFLWKLSDKVFFEGEFNTELASGGGTSIELEYAQVSYIANDYLTFGAGKFLNPVNYFVEQLHPAWINKLPDRPLAVFNGLLPEGIVGAQLHGAAPLGPTKIKYAVFVGNAPSLDTQPVGDSHAGILNFDDQQFAYSHITVGGHAGFFPIPELELGYGIQSADVGPEGSGVRALWQSADLNYVRDSTLLKGVIDFKAQWVWSNIDLYTVDPTTGLTRLPAGLSNDRNGGYVQFAYRPTKVNNKILKNLEPVVRYDMLNQGNTPIGFDERRWTFGMDYWVNSSTVFKAAYETDRQNGLGQNGDAFWLQFVVGF